MKKVQEILGLPIISISDGMEVGKVKTIITNAEKGAVDYIVVDSGVQIFSARVLSTDNILGIGEYAITIENASNINDISKIPAAVDLLQTNTELQGIKVLTKKGRLIGEVGDIFVDEENSCIVSAIEFIADITQKKVKIIPRDCIITFGKNILIVREDIEDYLLDDISNLSGEKEYIDEEKKNESLSEEKNISEIISDLSKEVDDYSEETEDSDDEPDIEIDDEEVENVQQNKKKSGKSKASDLFEQRQKQYLKGKIVTKSISSTSGKVIIKEGVEITDEIFETAKANGKLVELVMNNSEK